MRIRSSTYTGAEAEAEAVKIVWEVSFPPGLSDCLTGDSLPPVLCSVEIFTNINISILKTLYWEIEILHISTLNSFPFKQWAVFALLQSRPPSRVQILKRKVCRHSRVVVFNLAVLGAGRISLWLISIFLTVLLQSRVKPCHDESAGLGGEGGARLPASLSLHLVWLRDLRGRELRTHWQSVSKHLPPPTSFSTNNII